VTVPLLVTPGHAHREYALPGTVTGNRLRYYGNGNRTSADYRVTPNLLGDKVLHDVEKVGTQHIQLRSLAMFRPRRIAPGLGHPFSTPHPAQSFERPHHPLRESCMLISPGSQRELGFHLLQVHSLLELHRGFTVRENGGASRNTTSTARSGGRRRALRRPHPVRGFSRDCRSTHKLRSSGPHPALEATQGQNDSFFSRLPYKCYLEEVASVGD